MSCKELKNGQKGFLPEKRKLMRPCLRCWRSKVPPITLFCTAELFVAQAPPVFCVGWTVLVKRGLASLGLPMERVSCGDPRCDGPK